MTAGVLYFYKVKEYERNKKANSFEALSKIQFDNLAPDPVNYEKTEKKSEKQHLEAHFSNKITCW